MDDLRLLQKVFWVGAATYSIVRSRPARTLRGQGAIMRLSLAYSRGKTLANTPCSRATSAAEAPIPLVSAIGPGVNYASARSGGEPCMPIGTSCGVSAVRAKQAMETGTSALDKIAALLEFMADGLTNDPPKVRFVLQFDAMYARHRPVERLLWLETRISTQGFESFSALIREGLTDGSPRPDLDPALTMHAVINAVIGTQRRLASLGDRVELEYGKPIDVLFREIIRIILLGLRATGPAVAPNIRRPSQPKRKRHS